MARRKKNKNLKGVLAPLAQHIKKLVCVPMEGGHTHEDIEREAHLLGINVICAASCEGGVDHRLVREVTLHPDARLLDTRLLVCGSLHLVGDFLDENSTP